MSYEKTVCDKFKTAVIAGYELDDDTINTMCKIVADALSSTPRPTVKRSKKVGGQETVSVATSTPVVTTASVPVVAVPVPVPEKKQTRNKSGYNLFVQSAMQLPEISALSHKLKMAAIGSKWKTLSDEEKLKFKKMADDANLADSATVNTSTA